MPKVPTTLLIFITSPSSLAGPYRGPHSCISLPLPHCSLDYQQADGCWHGEAAQRWQDSGPLCLQWQPVDKCSIKIETCNLRNLFFFLFFLIWEWWEEITFSQFGEMPVWVWKSEFCLLQNLAHRTQSFKGEKKPILFDSEAHRRNRLQFW